MDPNLVQPLFFGAIILVIIGLMVRNGRKRQKDEQTKSSGLRAGAEIMTSSGIFGRVVSVDEENSKILLETHPGSHITIHRQAVGRIVTPVAEDGTQLNGEPVVLDDAAADPEFGERVTLAKGDGEETGRRTGGTSKGAAE